jgi:hypothetical protein
VPANLNSMSESLLPPIPVLSDSCSPLPLSGPAPSTQLSVTLPSPYPEPHPPSSVSISISSAPFHPNFLPPPSLSQSFALTNPDSPFHDSLTNHNPHLPCARLLVRTSPPPRRSPSPLHPRFLFCAPSSIHRHRIPCLSTPLPTIDPLPRECRS